MAAPRPISPIVIDGKTAYLSGQLGLDPDNNFKLVPGSIEAETRQTFNNIGRVLRSQGLSYGDVVKVTVFLTDLNDFSKMNEVYRQYFPKNFPARSAVKVAGLVVNARIEIECIASFGHAVRPMSKL
ncbi:2-iminobutanoate/2-iminopropanoate deaminase-like isoform X1 [Apostichopus japonicus]|uniref:2-iminobutanoate/2-iminopropanoate deaminase-like isoform X1 n=1 Tax=Stichopus japonicus TaxID=307972 RepID=UPI003AB23AE9